MKKSLIALALLAASGVANAGLSFDTLATVTRSEAFNPGNGLPTFAVGSTLSIGTLKADNPYKVTYTYLGSESGFNNVFYNLYVSGSKMFEGVDPVGTSVTGDMTSAGALDFKFEGYNGNFAYNDRVLHSAWNSGGTTPGWSEKTSIGLIGTNMTVGSQTYAYVIGYNDSAGSVNPASLGDWDDFVIGVNIAPIPEPETYAMLIAGLGLMGFVARRRKQKSSV